MSLVIQHDSPELSQPVSWPLHGPLCFILTLTSDTLFSVLKHIVMFTLLSSQTPCYVYASMIKQPSSSLSWGKFLLNLLQHKVHSISKKIPYTFEQSTSSIKHNVHKLQHLLYPVYLCNVNCELSKGKHFCMLSTSKVSDTEQKLNKYLLYRI